MGLARLGLNLYLLYLLYLLYIELTYYTLYFFASGTSNVVIPM
jgi:hypothetical protein